MAAYERLVAELAESAAGALRYQRAALRQAVERKKLDAVPVRFKMLRTPRKPPAILTPEQVRALLDEERPSGLSQRWLAPTSLAPRGRLRASRTPPPARR
jgi:integrase